MNWVSPRIGLEHSRSSTEIPDGSCLTHLVTRSQSERSKLNSLKLNLSKRIMWLINVLTSTFQVGTLLRGNTTPSCNMKSLSQLQYFSVRVISRKLNPYCVKKIWFLGMKWCRLHFSLASPLDALLCTGSSVSMKWNFIKLLTATKPLQFKVSKKYGPLSKHLTLCTGLLLYLSTFSGL